ncbi:multidrug effflux MFS transporter [Roseateles paludis]|jgi:DHA1 family bicyclomycin/chloramphenicol resistance-like MFS transporter|uniref:Bcr/CflA family efflux transporter n=1 Tax=Roseateles paludis TaxID=3145238 RepID=A0ABV0G2G2_9BURK
MNPEASRLWRAPRWALSILLACLGMLGPFSTDTYLPAFAGITQALHATPLQMQQTLSSYLFGFAVMNLFHGSLSDCFGRRPVVLIGLTAFTLASLGCALAGSVEALIFWRAVQGMSAGAGIVVSRAIIRDMYPPADAQRAMSQVTLFFGVAPAVAPMIGGFLFVHADWHSIFWFLVAIGLALLLANARWLPETLHTQHKHPFHVGKLLREYARLISSPRFVLLVLASGIPFNGMFLYVLATPVFLGEHLQFAPTQFFWFFCCTIGGIMAGAAVSGRLAGKVTPAAQIKLGFQVMVVMSVVNIALNLWVPLSAWWALPVLGLFAFGWAIMVPVVTLLVLDQVPERRGMASSLQACVGSAANGLVAGALVPLVMHSTHALAFTSAGLMCIGLVAWVIVQKGLKT